MALQKQVANLNFANGIDFKTDPLQIPFGKFASLVNMNFTTGKRLTKRNGFGLLPTLPVSSLSLTTLAGNLTALGSKIQAYSSESEQWTQVANYYPCNLSTLPVVRSGTNQSQVDSAIAPNGLLCMAWTDQNPSSLSTRQFKYAVFDSSTGQVLLPITVLSAANTTYGMPRVFVLGNYFIIGFVSTSTHLQYIAISINSLSVGSPVDVSTSIGPSTGGAWDAAILNNTLFFAWNGESSSGLKMASLSATLGLSANVTVDSAHTSTLVSVCVDTTAAVVYATYYSSGSTNGYTVAVNHLLVKLTNFPTESIIGLTLANVASCIAVSGTLSIFVEVVNAYSYDASIPSNFIQSIQVTQSSGAVTSPVTVVRSVGLASKAFVIGGVSYFLSAYQSPYQPTYFLINGVNGNPVAELAYENGGGYLSLGLPSVSVSGQTASVAYLYKDLIEAVSDANQAGTSVVGGVYNQTGINQATFTIGTSATLTTAEIGANLNISGGFLWGYDGTQATEQGFFLYPDSIEATTATTGGAMTAQQYFYQVIYSWTDNRGNYFRSAGSIPISITVPSGTSTNTVTLTGPNLRLSYKQNVKIEIYRYSAGQQEWYQVTSVATPFLNTPGSDSWSYIDTLADSAIQGNQLLYTTGGIVEDIGGPSFASVFTFDDRLWGIDSEDRNLLWFSKQVIEGTPVELSDLLTLYVAPSIGAQGPTGALTCGAQMDDKAILFKPTALYYINGTGPDNTGANNNYSQPTFITSMVGCTNQASIVFQSQGLMFEFASEAGNQIWLLGRDLSTKYIGADVERLTLNASVTSAVSIPGTNQVRFSLSSGITIVYDYFYGQWSQYTTNALSSTLYQGLHTYFDPYGRLYQETPGEYLDGSTPVVMSFVTSWLNLTGLQGYQRAYWFYFLGQYMSPHKIQLGIAYDYNPSPTQLPLVYPSNFSPIYGQGLPYGDDTPYGGPGSLEQWKIFLTQERCQAFQISFQEIYDPSFGVEAGAGLSVSGLNLVFGQKKGYVPLPFSQGTS